MIKDTYPEARPGVVGRLTDVIDRLVAAGRPIDDPPERAGPSGTYHPPPSPEPAESDSSENDENVPVAATSRKRKRPRNRMKQRTKTMRRRMKKKKI